VAGVALAVAAIALAVAAIALAGSHLGIKDSDHRALVADIQLPN
jgi:hypothetical protein